MTPHRQLLADYSEKNSQEAFRELVTLYIGMVHSSAVRLVNGDTHRAQDIVQTVFADLARHARTVSTEATIGGWLHRRTCHVAATVMRTERRRENRERQAVEMNALHENPDEALAQVAPVLDEAIDELNAQDRHAIMLRFFEHCDLRTIGEALGSNEDAAQKRIARALEKLRFLLARRGVALSGTALALALGSEAASAAPAGLAASVSAGALTVAHVSKGFSLTAAKIIIMTKLKATEIAAISTLILAGVGTTLVVVNRDKPYQPIGQPKPSEILQQAEADTTAGRYKDSLAKHIWLQDKSLQYQPSFVGARSSFALNDFGRLAKKYSPAMKKLESIRNKAEKTIREKNTNLKTGSLAFGGLTSINRALNEIHKTVECFIWLDLHNPDLAKSVFSFAEPDLMNKKEYKLCGRYIDPDRSYQMTLQAFRLSMKSTNPKVKNYFQKSCFNRMATLVALMALNDRQQDADLIAAKAAKEWNDPAFLAQLDEARNGIVPAALGENAIKEIMP